MSQIDITRERAFEILKVEEGIGFGAIKHAYRKQLLKWHPKRHNHSSESIHMFLEIREAFKFLTDGLDDDDDEIWAAVTGGHNSMFRMKAHGGYVYVICDDGGKLIKGQIPSDSDDEMTMNIKREKANKAAADLINEENKEKKKADKRRQKKQRQKMRKKQAKQLSENRLNEEPDISDEEDPIQNGTTKPTEDDVSSASAHFQDSKVSNKHRGKMKKQFASKQQSSDTDSENGEEEPGWDKDSAFFNKVAQNSTVNKKVPPKVQPKVTKDEPSSSGQATTPTNILESRKFALEGNNCASANDFSAAIELFTKAITLHNHECKYFGNRAYCYEKLKIYGSALEDANTAISLSPDWVKGHFRRGKALCGLKQYAEAEQAFEKVLKLDKNNKEAEEALKEIQLIQLMNMGFSKELCEVALKKKGTVQLALEEMLSGVLANSSLQDVYISDEEDAAFFEDEIVEETNTPPQTNGTDNYSEVEYNSLWVGNITPDITRDEMEEYFCQFGELKNINVLYQSHCAFINYVDSEAAKLALLAGDTIDVGETTLIIRYPDRAFSQRRPQVKECHYWRNHGCHYGTRCHYAHIPENRGIEIYGKKSGQN